MDFKPKNRDDISRLVSDRQSYISSLELKLEKFTRNTTSYLEIKEKLDKACLSLSLAEEKIQGLDWQIKQQNENHQQQIKALISRLDDFSSGHLAQSLAQSSLSPNSQSKPFADLVSSTFDSRRVTKDIEQLVALHATQVKTELDQRLDIFSSKQQVMSKTFEQRVDCLNGIEQRLKHDLHKEFDLLLKQNSETVKDLEYKLEAAMSLNSERYKELILKVNSLSPGVISEELGGMRQKIMKIEEFGRVAEESEMRRELEVKEASQAAWTVERQLKSLENELGRYNGLFSEVKVSQERMQKVFEPIDDKVNYLGNTVQKYLNVMKALHKKVDVIQEIIETEGKQSRRVKEKEKENEKEKERSNSGKERKENKGERSCSPMNSARLPTAKRVTPKKMRMSKNSSVKRSRIDILYDELNNMFT